MILSHTDIFILCIICIQQMTEKLFNVKSCEQRYIYYHFRQMRLLKMYLLKNNRIRRLILALCVFFIYILNRLILKLIYFDIKYDYLTK